MDRTPPEPARSRHQAWSLSAAALTVTLLFAMGCGQQEKPEPQPRVVNPGPVGGPPSDAIVLFDGKGFDNFRGEHQPKPTWKLVDGAMEIAGKGGIFSRQEFGDCQLHVEWASPIEVEGKGQERGNSGVFLLGRYQVQILDSYDNKTYADGHAGALYGVRGPMVNPSRKPGEWQSFDIVFHAPQKLPDGKFRPGSITVFQNGVLVQDHTPVEPKPAKTAPFQTVAPTGPLFIQDHHDAVRFRNIWLRPLPNGS